MIICVLSIFLIFISKFSSIFVTRQYFESTYMFVDIGESHKSIPPEDWSYGSEIKYWASFCMEEI